MKTHKICAILWISDDALILTLCEALSIALLWSRWSYPKNPSRSLSPVEDILNADFMLSKHSEIYLFLKEF